jgi:FkbM family methyltransferase
MTAQSPSEALNTLLSEHRQRGETSILINLCEHSFRSFFDQYTDVHRKIFVAIVLDQILLACPNSFFFLYCHSDASPDGFAADDVFQSYAAIWLHEHGRQGFVLASSLTIPSEAFPQLCNSLDLAISGQDAVIRSLSQAPCPLLVLMGGRKSFSRLESLNQLLSASPLQQGRTVPELHSLSGEVRRLIIGAPADAGSRREEISTTSATFPTFGRRARLAQRLPFLRNVLFMPVSGHEPPSSSSAAPFDTNVSSPLAAEFDLRDPNLESSLRALTESHFQSLASRPDLVDAGIASITFDGNPSFIPDMLERDSLHDEDYVVFRFFRDPESLILDIGANWGYSVSSIEASGARSQIISFEAIPMYRPCLAAIAALRPKRYSFFMTALSDQPSDLVFTVPVVNDHALSALTTAAEQPIFSAIAHNVVNHIRQWMSDLDKFQYRLASFRVPVQRLDDVVQANPGTFRSRDVVAIKIDVEGMEYPVLRGSEKLLLQHRPLIIAEGATSNEPLVRYLVSLGYRIAQREGDTLTLPASGQAYGVNGFFIHQQKLDAYRNLGVLA